MGEGVTLVGQGGSNTRFSPHYPPKWVTLSPTLRHELLQRQPTAARPACLVLEFAASLQCIASGWCINAPLRSLQEWIAAWHQAECSARPELGARRDTRRGVALCSTELELGAWRGTRRAQRGARARPQIGAEEHPEGGRPGQFGRASRQTLGYPLRWHVDPAR